jgi:hypothetical protein
MFNCRVGQSWERQTSEGKQEEKKDTKLHQGTEFSPRFKFNPSL